MLHSRSAWCVVTGAKLSRQRGRSRGCWKEEDLPTVTPLVRCRGWLFSRAGAASCLVKLHCCCSLAAMGGPTTLRWSGRKAGLGGSGGCCPLQLFAGISLLLLSLESTAASCSVLGFSVFCPNIRLMAEGERSGQKNTEVVFLRLGNEAEWTLFRWRVLTLLPSAWL